MPLDQQITIRMSRDAADTITVWTQRIEAKGERDIGQFGFYETTYLHDFTVRWKPEFEGIAVQYMRVTDQEGTNYDVVGITFPTPRRKWARLRVQRAA